ncbi:MAG: lysostaphin resistance A-like protein [Candidatus Dormibacteria bacterium]
MVQRDAPWWGAAIALLAMSSALAIALLLPETFSDPNGLDPHVLRLSLVGTVLGGASLVSRRLAPARPVLLAMATVTIAFSVFSGTPRILVAMFGAGISGPAQLFWASVAQLAATGALGWTTWAGVSPDMRPDLRLHRFSLGAVAVTAIGIVLFVPIGIAIPAGLLGREGIAVVAVGRDMGWLAPACLLQALCQEIQFRGLLQGALERVAPLWPANLAQAAVFGAAHLAIQYPGPIGPFVPVTMGFGVLFGVLVQRTGSLWPAVLIHAAADIAITVAVIPGLYGL